MLKRIQNSEKPATIPDNDRMENAEVVEVEVHESPEDILDDDKIEVFEIQDLPGDISTVSTDEQVPECSTNNTRPPLNSPVLTSQLT